MFRWLWRRYRRWLTGAPFEAHYPDMSAWSAMVRDLPVTPHYQWLEDEMMPRLTHELIDKVEFNWDWPKAPNV